MFEGGAVEELHGDVAAAFVLANFVDGADVGMVESGGGAGFTAKTFEGLRVAGQVFGKKFQGDEAAEFGVLGFVDYTHAATAEFFDDEVARDFFAGKRLRVGHWCGYGTGEVGNGQGVRRVES